MRMWKWWLLFFGLALLAGCVSRSGQAQTSTPPRNYPLQKSDEEWRRQLTSEQYHVLREKGTERPFTGKYAEHHQEGTFACAGCHEPLFLSRDKFESGTGWPSFHSPYSKTAVAEESDGSHGMRRTEVLCAHCGGHLGHVFPDGPRPTGLRYCINSAALEFRPKL